MFPMVVRCHLNVFSTDDNLTTTAISKLGVTPVRDTANAPAQFWTSIPGNESGLAFSEYMTMEMQSSLCLNLYDGFDTGIADGVLKMSDRIRLVPQRFDIQEKALDHGLIENYNVFLLGPSGSGKSFFMNKYLRACYMAGAHDFLIDQGASYRALCHIIKEKSDGKDGPYDYLLNSAESVNILEDRFVVFEIDHIKGDPVIYPITTLVIMDAFMEKMTSNSDFKVMCIEEAWKAIMGTQMATYMLELWKTARKHRTSAMVVTQELKDITSSPIIRDSIVENSGVKILLDQTKYVNRFDVLASELSLSEDDKAMVLSLNRLKIPGASGREVFFNLGNKKSFVMRLEVSPEERIAFSSQKRDKEKLAAAVEKSGGSYIKAIKKLTKKGTAV